MYYADTIEYILAKAKMKRENAIIHASQIERIRVAGRCAMCGKLCLGYTFGVGNKWWHENADNNSLSNTLFCYRCLNNIGNGDAVVL